MGSKKSSSKSRKSGVITKEQLSRVLQEYYSRNAITVSDWNVEEFPKSWQINSSFEFIGDIVYDQYWNDIILPSSVVVKSYNNPYRRITKCLEGDSGSAYRKEKLMHRFLTENVVHQVPVSVMCYNQNTDVLDEQRVLVFEYGGEEHENQLIEILYGIKGQEKLLEDFRKRSSREKAVNSYLRGRISGLESKVEDILKESLRTTALLHTKMFEMSDPMPTLRNYGVTTQSPQEYRGSIIRYLQILFGEEIKKKRSEELNRELKGLPLEALANYLGGKDSLTEDFITIIHGDANNRNFLDTGRGYTLLCDWGRTTKGLRSFDLAKQLLNDIVPLSLKRIEPLIEEHYLERTEEFARSKSEQFKVKDSRQFVGSVLVGSLYTLLKNASFIKRVRKDFPEHYEAFSKNEPHYAIKGIGYNLTRLREVFKALLGSDYGLSSEVGESIENLNYMFEKMFEESGDALSKKKSLQDFEQIIVQEKEEMAVTRQGIRKNYQDIIGFLREDNSDRNSGREIITPQILESPPAVIASVQYLDSLGVVHYDKRLLLMPLPVIRKRFASMVKSVKEYFPSLETKNAYNIARGLVAENPQRLVEPISSSEEGGMRNFILECLSDVGRYEEESLNPRLDLEKRTEISSENHSGKSETETWVEKYFPTFYRFFKKKK